MLFSDVLWYRNGLVRLYNDLSKCFGFYLDQTVTVSSNSLAVIRTKSEKTLGVNTNAFEMN